MFDKTRFLKIFERFTGNTCVDFFFFNEVASLRHRCFPVNLAKFFKTPIFIEHLNSPGVIALHFPKTEGLTGIIHIVIDPLILESYGFKARSVMDYKKIIIVILKTICNVKLNLLELRKNNFCVCFEIVYGFRN